MNPLFLGILLVFIGEAYIIYIVASQILKEGRYIDAVNEFRANIQLLSLDLTEGDIQQMLDTYPTTEHVKKASKGIKVALYIVSSKK